MVVLNVFSYILFLLKVVKLLNMLCSWNVGQPLKFPEMQGSFGDVCFIQPSHDSSEWRKITIFKLIPANWSFVAREFVGKILRIQSHGLVSSSWTRFLQGTVRLRSPCLWWVKNFNRKLLSLIERLEKFSLQWISVKRQVSVCVIVVTTIGILFFKCWIPPNRIATVSSGSTPTC